MGLAARGRYRLALRPDMLDQRAAQCDVQQLLAAANAKHRHVASKRAAGHRQLKIRAGGLQHHFGMLLRRAELALDQHQTRRR